MARCMSTKPDDGGQTFFRWTNKCLETSPPEPSRLRVTPSELQYTLLR